MMNTDQLETIVQAESATDPWLDGLMLLARHFGRPVAAQSLRAGLPLENGCLPQPYVAEAATRAGLVVRATEWRAEALMPLALPAIAQDREGAGVVLLKRRADEILVVRGTGDGTWVDVQSLLANLQPQGFFVQAQLYLDARSAWHDAPDEQAWFWGPLRANLGSYAYAGLASFVINLVSLSATFYVMAVYDRVIPNRSYDTLLVLTVGVVGLYVVDAILKQLRGYLLDSASRRFDVLVGQRVFAQLLSVLPQGRPASAGTLASTVREFDTLREFFSSATLTLLADVPFLVVFIAVLALFAGPVAWVPVIALPVGLFVTVLFLRPMARVTDQLFREGTQRSALLHEVVSQLDTLRAIGGAGWARRSWDQLLQQQAETTVRSRELAHGSLNLTMLVQQLVTVGVVVVGALLVADSKLTVGALVACSILAGRAIAPLAAISSLLNRIHSTRASLGALDKLMCAPSDIQTGVQPLHLGRVDGRLDWQGVQFSYPVSEAGNAPLVLRGISVSIQAGEHVAIIGRVGSGKSSLLSLAMRLHEPQSGHVLLDGIDVRQLHGADLRHHVGFVPQEPVLFHGTIRDNMTLAHPACTDEQLVQAVRLAGLDELFNQSMLGLATPVGEGGRHLSGGIRQALTLARALVSEPAVLLLDEPTSMMDPNMERTVLSRLLTARAGKTTVFVTHRPAVLKLVSRVIVIEAGQVVADGPRDAILASLAG